MQTSGTAPALSDGVKKEIVTAVPSVRRVATPRVSVKPVTPASTHRRGGFSKHKGSK